MAGFTEDELIEVIRRLLAEEMPGVALGLGDDAALVEMGSHLGILTADMLVEGIHFERHTVAPTDLGYKALAVNVSDIAAMGGSPRYGLVSLGLSEDIEASWVVELYGGLRDAAREYAMAVIGGDTSRADRLVVSVAVTGEVARGAAVTRSGAMPGDRLVVTGALGASAGGLKLLQAPAHDVAPAVSSEWGRSLVEAHLRPAARVGEGQTLAQSGATAMMDVSDGLTKDLGRLCQASEVAAAIVLADLPIALSLKELTDVLPDVDPLTLALEGGEDYELLATLPPGAVRRTAAKLAERFGTQLTEIGEIREGSGLIAIQSDGSERPLEPRGWDHFGG
ncbi:MAG TPA: thiamine-phosphate kinase [Actinomycetota bacterium]|nr:thiamine-phosphate kinase [Actinomycetota bacterium]